MAYSISGSVGKWESNARNTESDIRTIQTMLIAVAKNSGKREFDPGGVDGKISRIPGNSNTVKAIVAFQRQVVGMATPDGRIDVGGATWLKLSTAAGVAPIPTTPVFIGHVTLAFKHGNKIPEKTHYNPAVASTHIGLYESTVLVSGGLTGSFRGSIFPDDMMVKGRIKDGTYPIHIGFHHGGGAAQQGADKLKVETEGIRPGLLVNARNSVPVISANPSKTTSVGVNVHNGFNSKRFAESCLTIQPSDWSNFISLFLNAFPNINDWHSVGVNTGKKVGDLIVSAF